MFRLIKLAIYAFVGYALYQFYQGLMQQQPVARGRGRSGGAFRAGRTEDYGASPSGASGQNLTGAGMGQAEETLENDGGSVRHNVGRGVTAP